MTPCRPSRRASLPSLGGTAPCPVLSLPSSVGHPPTRAGRYFERLPWAATWDGDDRASHVPWGPHCLHAPLFDPGGPVRTCQSVRPTASREATFRAWYDVGPTMFLLSGLNHAAYRLAVYASQDGLPHHHARLASKRWPASRAGSYPPKGPSTKFPFHVMSCHVTSPLSEPRGANQVQDQDTKP